MFCISHDIDKFCIVLLLLLLLLAAIWPKYHSGNWALRYNFLVLVITVNRLFRGMIVPFGV